MKEDFVLIGVISDLLVLAILLLRQWVRSKRK